MNKRDFIVALRDRLSDLPEQEVEAHLSFYSEMIDDRMEDGLSEEDSVAAIGSVDEIAAQIAADFPSAREKTRSKRRIRAWEILLLVLGSPIWLPLAIGAFVVLLSLYAVLWSLIVSAWAVFASLIACALGGAVACVVFACQGYALTGVAMLGAGFVCAGLSILLFFGALAATKGTARMTDRIALGVKKRFVKKEGA